MKISEFLAHVREFTDYIQHVRSLPPAGPEGDQASEQLTEWDYLLSVYGPVPALFPRGVHGRVFDPLQAVAAGWEECHDFSLWTAERPKTLYIRETLDLSADAFDKISAAITMFPRNYNKRLRGDLIAACGLQNESETNYFKGHGHA